MKSESEIMKLGTFDFWEVFSSQNFFFLLIDVLFLGIIVFLYMRWKRKREEFSFSQRFIKKFLLMLSIGFLLAISLGFYIATNMKLEEKWKEKYVKPYLDAMEVEKSEITSIKKGSNYIQISSEDGNITDVQLKQEDFEISETNALHPTVEYVKLENDLGNGITKGVYNIHLYLPADYEIEEVTP